MDELTITAIEAIECRIPLARPFDLGPYYHVAHRDYTIVRIRTSSGIEGVSYSLSRNAEIAATVRRNIAPLWLGQSAHEVERLWHLAYNSNITAGQRGIFARALSLADIAVWDIKAQAAGLPLWKLLGGFRNFVPGTIVVAYPFAGLTHDQIRVELEEVLVYQPLGVKLSSCSDYAEDTRRLQLARQIVGPDIHVMIDLHFDWRDVKLALRWAREWESLQLAWIEDPFPPEMIAQAAELRAGTSIPIAIGDDQSSKMQIMTLLQQRAIDILRLDVTALGGITEFRKVVGLAETFSIRLASHIYVSIHAHCLAAISNAYCVEWIRPVSGIENIEYLWQEVWPFTDGGFRLPETPGIGQIWNWEAVNRYKISHSRLEHE
jgi:L-alanine-DL-glutamate epimerase-like enolase superfamily enzyme